MVCGMLQSQSVQLADIAERVPNRGKIESQITQFRRWLKNENVSYELFYLPFVEQIIQTLSKAPLVLIIDGSVTAKKCVTLMVSVAYKGRALPLMWITREGKKGHFPQQIHLELIQAVQKIIPSHCDVVCLGDGEFDGTEWLQMLSNFGWNYVCRTSKNAQCYEEDEKFELRDICPARGKSTLIENVEFTSNRRIRLNVVAWWGRKYQEPVYWVTSFGTAEEAEYWYVKRFKIETMFSDLKSRGFHLHKSHLSKPDRVSRLLIATCIAYVWQVFLGVFAQKNDWNKILFRTDREELSLFRCGQRLLNYFLCNGQVLPIFEWIT